MKSALLSAYCYAAVLLSLLLQTSTVAATPFNNNNDINTAEEEIISSTNNINNSHNNDEPSKDNSPVLCSLELNQYCPPSTTCCPKKLRHSIVGYSCLVSWSSRVPQGPCCDDDDDDIEAEEADFDAPSSPSNIFGSGCAAGYTCAAPLQSTSTNTNTKNSFVQHDDSLVNTPHCKRDDAHDSHPLTDKTGRPIINDYERMPRYVTCPAFSYEDIALPHGLPIPLSSATSYDKSTKGKHSAKLYEESQTTTAEEGEKDDGYMGQLAYFSNMGPLTTAEKSSSSKSQLHSDVTTAVIGIHGSGRDAGSYLCAMIAAVNGDYTTSTSSSTSIEQTLDDMELWEGQERRHIITSTQRRRRDEDNDSGDDVKKNEGGETLLISPWFLAPEDGEPETSSSTSTLPFLQWLDKAPVEHTFRYGAESIPVSIDEVGDETSSSTTTSISSYGAMDVLLETLCNKTIIQI